MIWILLLMLAVALAGAAAAHRVVEYEIQRELDKRRDRESNETE